MLTQDNLAESLAAAMRDYRRHYIRYVLSICSTPKQAARRLGVHLESLYRYCRTHDLPIRQRRR